MLFEIFAHPLDFAPFTPEIVGHRIAQARMRNVMRRMHGHRPIATGQLVLALRACLDHPQLAVDGEVDRLMIANLEMQEGVVLDAAPVAPIERVGTDEPRAGRDVGARDGPAGFAAEAGTAGIPTPRTWRSHFACSSSW